ncbi:MAG: hypothetical protein H6813_02685 [Phycisphaeraceae bacterium]|nr:hypothetical protein [Phycisphaeraceae bacterium]MCB9848777.1 hypothetical protein [Phycisphaeraceae bacterium]
MLPRPTPEYVRSRLPLFVDYADADAALELVFQAWPTNTDLPQVLAKVVTLNRLYSTSVFDVHGVARHIVSLEIDSELQASDSSLVPRIATFQLSNGKARYNYSFATKYCAWHMPDGFQIYDSRVDEALWRYQKLFQFTRFRRYDLGDYPKFMQIMDRFIDHFALHEFSRKQLDKFLWIEGGSLF